MQIETQYYVRKIFIEKSAEIAQQKLVPDFFAILVNNPKSLKYFGRRLSKILQKITWFWFLKQSLFLNITKTKGDWN